MTENVISCPLCKSEAISQKDDALDCLMITCPKCKEFKITNDALLYLSDASDTEREILIVKFDVVKEVYGQGTIPTISINGRDFEVHRK